MSLSSSMFCYVFFFFQAEDGIRDSSVTGVQTCALPISPWLERAALYRAQFSLCTAREQRHTACGRASPMDACSGFASQPRSITRDLRLEIGRASCRERV